MPLFSNPAVFTVTWASTPTVCLVLCVRKDDLWNQKCDKCECLWFCGYEQLYFNKNQQCNEICFTLSPKLPQKYPACVLFYNFFLPCCHQVDESIMTGFHSTQILTRRPEHWQGKCKWMRISIHASIRGLAIYRRRGRNTMTSLKDFKQWKTM